MAIAEISPTRYGELLAQTLPKVIETREEFDRYIETMEQLDRRAEKGPLSPEELACSRCSSAWSKTTTTSSISPACRRTR